jgi:benzoate/toluate 1,2-dioxygenase beta subunit/2,4,5-trichlorophenoxyacetic acid oxygenase 2
MAAADDAAETADAAHFGILRPVEAIVRVADLLSREGLFLDQKDWPSWIALYHPNAIFWVPAWKDEDTPTSNPDTEISLIYHDNRYGLEERIARIQSRKSVTAMPLPRTSHMSGSVIVSAESDDRIEASASFSVHIFDPRTSRSRTHHGRYEITLAREAGAEFLIHSKKVLLINDRVAATLDFYEV